MFASDDEVQELWHKPQDVEEEPEENIPWGPRTIEEYFLDCLYIFQNFKMADEGMISTGIATEVTGKHYPMRLRPWDEFTGSERNLHYNKIADILGNKRVFPRSAVTRSMTEVANFRPVATEIDIKRFAGVALEKPVQKIFDMLLEVKPDVKQEFNFTKLQLTHTTRELMLPDEAYQLPSADEKYRPPYYWPILPDGLGIWEHPDGENILAFVFDYKAAYKLRADESLKTALAKENLFMEVIQRINSKKMTTDCKLSGQDDIDMHVSRALTQVFDCMVRRGASYGFTIAGNSLVFLHVKQDDLRTLYYHTCMVDEEEVKNGTVEVSYTAVAQLASFVLFTIRSGAIQRSPHRRALERARSVLKIWPDPYGEAEGLLKTSSQLSQALTLSSPLHEGNKRREEPSRGSSDDHHEMPSDPDSPPTRQYCTQACLLSLKGGSDLDENCPNASSHRTVESGSRHPINASEFTSLVGEQLRQDPYRNCVAVDPHGFSGKIGLIGALFKLELAPYGYTFVGKGTLSTYLHCLKHESIIYSRLEKLQGEVVPVHLGIVDLAGPRGYLLPGDARVLHMMLMSWGGEVAAEEGVPDLETELWRSSEAVRGEGISHGDERTPNMLWNQERGRVMLIDFDRAEIINNKKRSKSSSPSKVKKISRANGVSREEASGRRTK
jgi:hypothetical protein